MHYYFSIPSYFRPRYRASFQFYLLPPTALSVIFQALRTPCATFTFLSPAPFVAATRDPHPRSASVGVSWPRVRDNSTLVGHASIHLFVGRTLVVRSPASFDNLNKSLESLSCFS